MQREAPAEYNSFDSLTERPVGMSRTVVSALKRSLVAARNRQNRAAQQVTQIEKLLKDLMRASDE